MFFMLWKNLTVFIFFICFNSATAKEDFSKLGIYVDTFIGTGGEGNTFPGALRPWGMVSVNPHTKMIVYAQKPYETSA